MAVSFGKIRDEEQAYVKAFRKLRDLPEDCDEQVALALSGGGIRSASFQLGVLQGLATANLFRNIDYLSAVSGGAYIAAWLSKCIFRLSFATTQNLLASRESKNDDEIAWLRRNTSFLTPRLGIFSHDLTLFATTYLHTFVVNAVVLFFLSASALVLPRLLLTVFALTDPMSGTSPQFVSALIATSGAGLAAAALLIVSYDLLIGYSVRPLVQGSDSPPHRHWILVVIFAYLCIILIALVDTRGGVVDRTVAASGLLWFFVLTSTGTEVRAYLRAVVFLLTVAMCSFVVTATLFPYAAISVAFAIPVVMPLIAHWREYNTGELTKRRTVAICSLAAGNLICAWTYFHAGTISLIDKRLFSYSRLEDAMTSLWHLHALGIVIVSVVTMLLIGILMLNRHLIATIFAGPLKPGMSYRTKRLLLKAFKTYGPWLSHAAAATAIVLVMLYGSLRWQELLQFINKSHRLGASYAPVAFINYFLLIVPILIVSGTLAFNVLVGLLGRLISPYKRERLHSISAFVYLYTGAWWGVCFLAIYAPVIIFPARAIGIRAKGFLVGWGLCLAICLAFPILPRFAGVVRRAVGSFTIKLVSYVVFAGWLVLIAYCLQAYFYRVEWSDPSSYFIGTYNTLGLAVFPSAAVAWLLSWLLSVGVGINFSSMHLFYQARVAWAFLAERLPRAPLENSEIGVRWNVADPTYLKELCPLNGANRGPFLILNGALNLADSQDLARQARKAANFVFTPYHCGYQPHLEPSERQSPEDPLAPVAYCRTDEYGGAEPLRLALATALSGSALGSNMGAYTNSRVRFINTLLNFRLGWWLANPRYLNSWSSRIPRARLRMLLAELLGKTNDREPYVNISDGGHFENVGLYELIRRRCRLIIVSDASEDKESTFSSFGQALERCQADLACDISIHCDRLRTAAPSGFAKQRWTAGRIRYRASGELPEGNGVLIYVKASVCGREPFQLSSYRSSHPDFPNDATVNQWFTESEFESYRLLGFDIIRELSTQLDQNVAKSPSDLIKSAEVVADRELREGSLGWIS